MTKPSRRASRFAAWLLCLLPAAAPASLPLPATLEQLAGAADHILAGHVTSVEMVDGEGKPIADRGARTGPGLANTIYLVVKVDEVFFSRAKPVPATLRIPLDPFMHYSFGQIEEAHRAPAPVFLLLLRGPDFRPIVPGRFARPMADKDRALRIREKAQGSGKPPAR